METITFFVIGDPHFKVNNTLECQEATSKILEKIKELKPDIIVVMGDILDRHESIHVSPLKSATLFIKNLSEITTTYLLIGNHDRPNNSNFLTDDHPFTALKQWKNTIVVDRVIVSSIKGNKFTFVPYVPPGRFAEALSSVKSLEGIISKLDLNDNSKERSVESLESVKGARAIFCHQEFYGCAMGAIVSAIGDPWPSTAPLIISGHIHDYQELQNNIIYVGSMLQHAFGDNDSKSVSLFTFRAKDWEHQRIDLNLIKKKIVRIPCSEVATYQPPPNSLIKLVITGTWDETKSISKIARIRELTKMGVKISYSHLSSSSKEEDGSSSTKEEGSGRRSEITYLERLHLEIKDYPRQVAWMEKLFGSIQNRKKL